MFRSLRLLRAASAAKGEAFFGAVTQKIAGFLIELCELDMKTLYVSD